MFGALSIYLLLLVDGSAAVASHRDINQPSPEDIFNESVVPETLAGELAAYISCIQEWNQIIPQKFRDIPAAAVAKKESFDFDSLSNKLNALEFNALKTHLVALHRTRRVRRYVALQRRVKRKMLAALAKAKRRHVTLRTGRNKPVQPPQAPVLASSAAGLLEDAHSKLALTYPNIFADRLDFSSAHPAIVESGRSVGRVASVDARVRTYVEAFDSQTPVSDGSSEMLSREPGETGWLVSSSYQHLPTLEWVGDSHRDLETPLISENTSRMLGTLAGTPLQRDAGLVFGKLAPGWKIDFSGRAEIPVYLDSNLRIVTSDEVGSERYFVFLNAAPGAHLVYLNHAESGGDGAVAFPVMGGTATYLDLTHISYASVYGQVVLAGDEVDDRRAISRATVRVVGQASATGATNRRGYFHFDSVMVAADYPIFVETDKGTGFTHRYRVLPKNLQNLTLYRISRHQVEDWIGQIEGGISSESGIVLAAVPGVVANQPDITLLPSVRSVAPTLRMIPETYTLTPADLLHPRTALEVDENRFLGIEVPEGPVLAQVSQDADGKKGVVWSELTIASPNVVTLVGPY